MRVIILESEQRYFPSTPLSLTPVLGKPLLERVLEYWSARGATHFDLFLTQSPHRVERKLGAGARWGVQVRYHLTSPEHLTSWVGDGESVILGRLCDFPPPAGIQGVECVTVDCQQRWSGWAHGSLHQLLEVAKGRLTPEGLPAVYHPARALDSEEAFLALQMFFLRQGCVEARELQPGVWLAPGAEVDPTAQLIGPVYIGHDSVVGAHSRLGPAVVVERESWVGRDCHLAESWVRPGTMLLSGQRSLGKVLGADSRVAPSWASRLGALVLLLVSWPLLFFRRIERAPVAVSREREEWFCLRPLPAALWEVLRGRMDLFGRRPASLSQMRGLPGDWWETLLSTAPGIWGCHNSEEDDFFFCALRGQARWVHFLRGPK